MAASGYTPISLYYSTTASAVPTSGNLANGELGLNIADMKLYAKNSAGTVTLLASSGGAAGTVSSVAVSGGTTGLTTSGGPITTSGTITLAGTLATTNGGTGLTSFTSGGVVYASSTSALATGSALQFTGTSLLVGTTSATANFNFLATQATDAPAGLMVENTSNTASASAVMRYKSSGSIFAYTGLASPSRSSYAGLGANVLSMYTGGDAGISLVVDNAAGPITFNTNSAEAMRISPAGNVGIGTSSPSSYGGRLVVLPATSPITLAGANQIQIGEASSNINYRLQLGYFSDPVYGWLGSIQAYAGGSTTDLVLQGLNGNVGIGGRNINSYSKLHIIGGGTGAIGALRFSDSGSNYWDIGRDNGIGGAFTFTINGSEKARFSIAGGYSVGTTADPGAGSIYATGAITAYYSDARLKTVSGKIENALDKVAQLSGVYYTNNSVAKSFGYDSDEVQVGVLAQDVEAVLPQIVKAAPFDLDQDGNSKSGENYKTVQYERLVPLLIEAINELRAEVKALKGAI